MKKIKTKALGIGICALIATAAINPVAAQQNSLAPEPIALQSLPIQSLLNSISFTGPSTAALAKTHEDKLLNAELLHSYYSDENYKPIWRLDRIRNARAKGLLSLLNDSWKHGLNPAQYHTEEISDLLDGFIVTEARQLELLLSDAALRYAVDISAMRVDPKQINQRADYWRAPQEAGKVLADLSRSRNPVDVLEDMAPDNRFYKALQKELVSLVNEKSAYDRLLPMEFGGQSLFKPGARHQDVISLRQRLGVRHNELNGPQDYYDDALAAAVMKFQDEKSLDVDGVIGPQTRALLNLSTDDKIRQVVANLERQRWLEQDKPNKYIIVNIPQQTLWAVEDGQVQHEMPVIIGKASRKTKDFTSQITGIRLNPTWTAPLSIKMRDILPKVKEDPNYLVNKQIQVKRTVDGRREILDPHTIDWESMTWKSMNEISMVQKPGRKNALGSYRVLMPNRYDIYFHDTNQPSLFDRGQRTLSSGCVRMSEPEKIAAFILGGKEGWSEADTDRVLRSGRKTDILIDESFPSYIVYQSMWLDHKGALVYGPDFYKRDDQLIAALTSTDDFYVPETTKPARFAGLNR